MANIVGIDVSHHQEQVDWDAVAKAGNTFAFCKATEGVSFVDSQFHFNWGEMAGAGLVRGAYHFLRDDSDPVAQARHFVSTVSGFERGIPILDVETGASGASKPNIHHVRDWVAEFRRLVPSHPLVIYTGKWYWHDTIGNPFGADIGPLWHSEYDTGAEVDDGPESDVYGGWTACLIWQFTSSGKVPGVSGSCDRNIFYGELHKLHALGLYSTEAPDLDATQNTRLINAERDAKAALAGIKDIQDLLTDDARERSPAARLKEITIGTRGLLARDFGADLDAEDVAQLSTALVAALTEEGVPTAIAIEVLTKLGAALNANVEAPKPTL